VARLAGQEVTTGTQLPGLPGVNRLAPRNFSSFLPCPSVCVCLGTNNGLKQISAASPALNITQVGFCFSWPSVDFG